MWKKNAIFYDNDKNNVKEKFTYNFRLIFNFGGKVLPRLVFLLYRNQYDIKHIHLKRATHNCNAYITMAQKIA